MRTIVNKLSTIIEKPQHNPNANSSGGKHSAVKLPRISIPSFSGNYSEWTTFRDLFSSLVHKNESLDNVQKLHYLKGHLSGEAAQLIQHTPVTDANYAECWSTLERRYDNKKYLSNCILKRLFGLRRLNSESASGLKELLDTTVDCLNALKNLGIDVTTWDIIVIHVVTDKLDAETRKQWELFISGDDSLPTIDQFKMFMEQRFRALEFVEPHKLQSHIRPVAHPKVSLATDSTFKIACEYCSDIHKLCFCKKFTEQSVIQRRKFVTDNKICFNCLGSNHSSYNCKKTTTCRVCHKRHHTLLHPSSEVEGQEHSTDSEQNGDTACDESEKTIVACLSTGQVTKPLQVLLPTALVNAQAINGATYEVRALIDQGSQACFITEAAVKHLKLKTIPANGKVSGLSNDETTLARHKVKFQLLSRVEAFKMEIEAYVLSQITSYLPEQKVGFLNWTVVDHLQLADPQFNVPNKIDILLGADVFGTILKDGLMKCPTGSLITQDTTLGWILSGALNKGRDQAHRETIRVMHAHVDEIEISEKVRSRRVEKTTYIGSKKLLTEDVHNKNTDVNSTQKTEVNMDVKNLPLCEDNPLCRDGDLWNNSVIVLNSLDRKSNQELTIEEKDIEVRQNDNFKCKISRSSSDSYDGKSKAFYSPHYDVVQEDEATRASVEAPVLDEQAAPLIDALMIDIIKNQELLVQENYKQEKRDSSSKSLYQQANMNLNIKGDTQTSIDKEEIKSDIIKIKELVLTWMRSEDQSRNAARSFSVSEPKTERIVLSINRSDQKENIRNSKIGQSNTYRTESAAAGHIVPINRIDLPTSGSWHLSAYMDLLLEWQIVQKTPYLFWKFRSHRHLLMLQYKWFRLTPELEFESIVLTMEEDNPLDQ